jgi:hypothetical protein
VEGVAVRLTAEERRRIRGEVDGARRAFVASIGVARHGRLRVSAVDDRRVAVQALRAQGHSVRAIAGVLGVNRGSIENDLRSPVGRRPDIPTDRGGRTR